MFAIYRYNYICIILIIFHFQTFAGTMKIVSNVPIVIAMIQTYSYKMCVLIPQVDASVNMD
jgi:hypothetical protein